MISRKTKQKTLLKKHLETINTLFTAEELYEQTKKEDKEIGIATVYRYLKEETKNKELHTYTCGRKKLYSKNKQSHCHFECEQTGKTIHFNIENLDFLKKIQKQIPGKIRSVQLEIKGICNECT